MPRFRTFISIAAVGTALAITGTAGAAAPKLTGTVGPGFTITLKQSGRAVTTLKAGTYSITVSDRSNIHNFHLRGPGVNKVITGLAFVGTKTIVVKLTKGKYTFVCDPHLATMHGSFRVS